MTAEQFRRLALALPAAFEAPHFQYASFRIPGGKSGRIFATLPPELTHVHLFVDEIEREMALAMDSAGLEKLFWGAKAVGLRVALAEAPSTVIKRLLKTAHAQRSAKAPRRPA